MSWTDKKSIEHIKKIRDIFKVKTFVETGTYKGMNVLAHKDNFEWIYSCEKVKKYYDITFKKLIKDEGMFANDKGIWIYNEDSKSWLKWFKEQIYPYKDMDTGKYVIFYLDAHFYDKKRPKGKGKFVVLDELKALKGLKNAIIIIHDFDNNLGHITYDEISLDMKLVKKDLLKVNPNFKFYTNELSSCDIMTIREVRKLWQEEKITDQEYDDMLENLKYTWSKPEKAYRGILYCLPKKVKIEGLKEI